MSYVWYAVFALISSIGNTIYNRISSNKVGSVLSATIKSLFITFACFLICLSYGHLNILYSLTKEQWLWIGILGLVTIIDWLFYFLAIRRSYLEAFAPFESSAILFLTNLLFVIFMIKTVTEGGGTLNVIFFFTGLAFLLASTLFAVLNKKINPVKKIAWVIFSLISAIALAFTLVIVTLKLSDIPKDIVAFHQMFIVFIGSSIGLVFSKEKAQIKTLGWKTYLNFFISSIFNALLMLFRYKALACEGANPSIINIIIGMDFVFVSITTVLFFKAKNKKQLTVLILLVLAGFIFITLPTMI